MRHERLSPSPDLSLRHLRFGWACVSLFAISGLMLEYLHAFKSAAYLGTAAEPRRLLWTLSHAHGALIGLINIAFGLCIRVAPEWTGARPIIPSSCLIASGVLLPLGFFLGGLQPYGGDPGIAGFAIPAGAFLLIVALLLIACKRSMRG